MNPSRSPVRLAAAACLAAIALALAACGRAPAPVAAPRPVLVAQAEAVSSTAEGNSYIGEIRARDEAPVAFRVGGRIVERRVRLGAHVHAGEVLARLDPADLERAVQVDEANVAAAASHHDWADRQLERVRQEQARGLASRSELEQAEDAARAARAAWDSAQAREQLSRLQLSYATLVAQTDGVITQELAQLDQVVGAGQGVYLLARAGARQAVFELPASVAAACRAGQALSVRSAELPGRHFTAHIADIGAAADPQSRSVTVHALIDGNDPALVLGMSMTAQLGAASVDAGQVWLPAGAIFHDGEHPAVWQVDRQAGRLSLKDVTLGDYAGRRVRVGGLMPGQWVVAAGVHTLDAHDVVAPVEVIRPEDGQP